MVFRLDPRGGRCRPHPRTWSLEVLAPRCPGDLGGTHLAGVEAPRGASDSIPLTKVRGWGGPPRAVPGVPVPSPVPPLHLVTGVAEHQEACPPADDPGERRRDA